MSQLATNDMKEEAANANSDNVSFTTPEALNTLLGNNLQDKLSLGTQDGVNKRNRKVTLTENLGNHCSWDENVGDNRLVNFDYFEIPGVSRRLQIDKGSIDILETTTPTGTRIRVICKKPEEANKLYPEIRASIIPMAEYDTPQRNSVTWVLDNTGKVVSTDYDFVITDR
jgi:hypothetical protein